MDTLKQGLVSVVLPSYNEEASIPRAAETITAILTRAGIDHELVFVDDGSRDRTWVAIQGQSTRFPQVRGVKFSRNFGKEAAIFAGLAQSRGDCTVVMDCDLQHPPEKVVEMYRLWQQGFQVVEGVKADRGKESPFHTFAAKSFYSIISNATGIDMSRASDFKLLDRRAVDTLLAMREKNAFFRALSSWIGFSTAQVEFEVQPRLEGESKWSIRSLVRYAMTNIASFSTAPLQLVTLLGMVVFVCSAALGVHSLWQKFTGHALEGFTTVILLQLIIGSILMICLGIIGYYIAKIYEEIKDRPRYIVADRCEGTRMMDKLKKLFDPTFFRFILVGVINTLVGYGVMFGLWNLAGLHRFGDAGYWISSAANYVVGSVVSFFLNKHFTFRNREKGAGVVARFILNISVCYLLAYGLAKPAAAWVLGSLSLSEQVQGNLTMLAGSCLFVALNYFGQRFFAFRTK